MRLLLFIVMYFYYIIIVIIIRLFSSPTLVDLLFKKQFRKQRFVGNFHLHFISFLFPLV
jgi:Na+/alanine symporter